MNMNKYNIYSGSPCHRRTRLRPLRILLLWPIGLWVLQEFSSRAGYKRNHPAVWRITNGGGAGYQSCAVRFISAWWSYNSFHPARGTRGTVQRGGIQLIYSTARGVEYYLPPYISRGGILSPSQECTIILYHGAFLWSLEEHLPVAALMIFHHGEVGGMLVYKFHDWSMGGGERPHPAPQIFDGSVLSPAKQYEFRQHRSGSTSPLLSLKQSGSKVGFSSTAPLDLGPPLPRITLENFVFIVVGGLVTWVKSSIQIPVSLRKLALADRCMTDTLMLDIMWLWEVVFCFAQRHWFSSLGV
ncbi:hypothetical protein ACLB2K_028717 [Fragaria x ananassa]